MNPPPFWNPIARWQAWSRENPGKAPIVIIMTVSLGMIALMVLATIVVIIGLLR